MWSFEKVHAFTLKSVPVDRGKCVFHLRVPYKDTLISGERREGDSLQKKTSSTWDKVHLSFTRWNRKLGLGNQMVALLAPFEKPQWHGLPIEKRRWKFSIPVGLSSYISCGHSGHAEFYSFFQLDAAYWSRPVDRTLDLLVMEWRCRLRKHLYRIAFLNSLL